MRWLVLFLSTIIVTMLLVYGCTPVNAVVPDSAMLARVCQETFPDLDADGLLNCVKNSDMRALTDRTIGRAVEASRGVECHRWRAVAENVMAFKMGMRYSEATALHYANTNNWAGYPPLKPEDVAEMVHEAYVVDWKLPEIFSTHIYAVCMGGMLP